MSRWYLCLTKIRRTAALATEHVHLQREPGDQKDWALTCHFRYLMHAFTCVERHKWAVLETKRVTSSYILLIVVLGDNQPEWNIVENMTSFQGQNYDLRSSYCTSKKSRFVRFTSISL